MPDDDYIALFRAAVPEAATLCDGRAGAVEGEAEEAAEGVVEDVVELSEAVPGHVLERFDEDGERSAKQHRLPPFHPVGDAAQQHPDGDENQHIQNDLRIEMASPCQQA